MIDALLDTGPLVGSLDRSTLPMKGKLKHLSRGMKMKAAFIGALSYRPALLVLDEPFTGLDPLVRDELIQGLLERIGETTLFLSSHDLAEIESFASHVGYLEQGRLLFSEEMTTLSNRFRKVEFAVDPASTPRQSCRRCGWSSSGRGRWCDLSTLSSRQRKKRGPRSRHYFPRRGRSHLHQCRCGRSFLPTRARTAPAGHSSNRELQR